MARTKHRQYPAAKIPLRRARSRLDWIVLAAPVLPALLLVVLGGIGALNSWWAAAAFQAGGDVVQWREGTELVIMLAPPAAGAALLVWPQLRRHPIAAFLALLVLFGVLLSEGDTTLLAHVAAAEGYRRCESLDVWDPHGGRGGRPALLSWGYSRGDCGDSGSGR